LIVLTWVAYFFALPPEWVRKSIHLAHTRIIHPKERTTIDPEFPAIPIVTVTNNMLKADPTLGNLLPKKSKLKVVNQTMSDADDAILQSYLDRATEYFEFGTGYSTLLAAKRPNIHRVHGVDADLLWLASIIFDVVPVNKHKLKLYFVDINANHPHYNKPLNDSKRANFPAYSLLLAYQQDMVPDTILIDGRFRVACAAQAALMANARTVIVMDDYMDRPEYHAVDAFLERIVGGEEIAVFRRRMDVSEDVIWDIYEEYKYTPA
jgi:protein O-GlcNAc transferase